MPTSKKELPLEKVRHIAQLAKLTLSPQEEKNLLENLNQILEYFEILDSIDIQNIEPMSHSLERENAFRKDEPLPSLPVEKALDQAPDQENQQVRIPEVIGE